MKRFVVRMLKPFKNDCKYYPLSFFAEISADLCQKLTPQQVEIIKFDNLLDSLCNFDKIL